MSRFIFVSLISLAFFSAGCQKNSNDKQTTFQSHPQSRPNVALAPVINNTKEDKITWSLSDEFTSSIFSCLSQKTFNLIDLPKVSEMIQSCKEAQNPFGTDISWIKKTFQNEQFVVFLELVKHEEVLKRPSAQEIDLKSCSADLQLSMRIRVFDLRNQNPRVVLQEMIDNLSLIHI